LHPELTAAGIVRHVEYSGSSALWFVAYRE
jgi:hypothetical protein